MRLFSYNIGAFLSCVGVNPLKNILGIRLCTLWYNIYIYIYIYTLEFLKYIYIFIEEYYIFI